MRKKKRITRKEIRTVYEIGYSFVRKVKFDHVSSFAGHAALFLLMSIFPMAMFCISVFSHLPIDMGRLTQYLLTENLESRIISYNDTFGYEELSNRSWLM